MLAIIYDKSKAPESLLLQEVEKPVPNDNEVLVKVIAVSVNAADYRSIKMGIVPKRKIYGSDIAGIVEATGKNVTGFKNGDEVFGDLATCGFGGFAEYTVATENVLAHKPKAISFETACALPMASVTALQGLRNQGKIQAGQKVLIYGAGGGVGTFAVQLAKYFSAEVTAVCSTNNVERVKSIGADIVIDYLATDLSGNGEKYDLILAVNGNNPISTYLRRLAPKGRCVIIGGSLSQIIKILVFGSFISLGNKKIQVLSAKMNTSDLQFIMQLVEQGKITPVIDRYYTLRETPEAIRYLGQGHARGKVIIQVAQEIQ
jgi:NADPH:quinone reductase-like Zn-dependent oxidoreductase